MWVSRYFIRLNKLILLDYRFDFDYYLNLNVDNNKLKHSIYWS